MKLFYTIFSKQKFKNIYEYLLHIVKKEIEIDEFSLLLGIIERNAQEETFLIKI